MKSQCGKEPLEQNYEALEKKVLRVHSLNLIVENWDMAASKAFVRVGDAGL